jgi:hypothetical protein
VTNERKKRKNQNIGILFIDRRPRDQKRKDFLIYEKFQLHRFYRKLADFTAGGWTEGG